MRRLEIEVNIHPNGKRFIHVELDGTTAEIKSIPNFLRAIAEDLERTTPVHIRSEKIRGNN